jgi:hypothetical protein
MSVQALPMPHVVGPLAAARESVATAAGAVTSALPDGELTAAIEVVAALEAQTAALRLELVAEAERREMAARSGATGTDAWAARLTGSTRASVAGGLWLVRRLQERYAVAREAFAVGAINEEQVRVIVKTADGMPRRVDAEQQRRAEEALVAKAVAGMDPRRLRQAARRMLEVVSQELADEHEAAMLVAEERRAEHETFLALHDNGDGTFSGKFTIPELHGHLLRTVLARLTSPRRHYRNAAGQDVVDESMDHTGELNTYERLGRAFTEVIEHLPTDASGGYDGKLGATVIVTLSYQHLLDGLASARLDTGARISAGEARRLACNAGIVPAVLGSRSEPLDVGQSVRLHTTAMRRAAALRHDSCATEGCERPFAWCELHHELPWSRGGPTSVANGVPLCGFHHRRAHDDAFTVRRLPTGEVRFRRRR